MDATLAKTPTECPWAVSITTISTLASASVSARSNESTPTPTAAPTRKRPFLSIHALGKSSFFWMSFTVINPASLPLSSTTNNFSMRCSCKISFAFSNVVPTGTVTRFSFVIRSYTFRSRFVSKRISRLVRMPTSLSPSNTGRPLT